MSLPALQDLKDYLRVETTAEDMPLSGMLARAGALARRVLARPIEATPMTYTIDDRRQSALALNRLSAEPVYRTFLRIPDAPIAASPAVTITDVDGVVRDPADEYRVDLTTGLVRGINGFCFSRFPYTVTATVGLQNRSDYDTVVEPALSQAILDIAADFYWRRNPAATDEMTGRAMGVRYGRSDETIPNRALDLLGPYRRAPL